MAIDQNETYIAIIDDDETLLSYYKQALSKKLKNLKIHTFKTVGEDFYKTDIIEPFDLFIMDINLGKDNGINISNKLLQFKRGLTFLFISGYDYSMKSLTEFDGKCIYDYIQKPIKTEELAIRVSAMINASKSYHKVLSYIKQIETECIDYTRDNIRQRYFEQIEKDRKMIEKLKKESYSKKF